MNVVQHHSFALASLAQLAPGHKLVLFLEVFDRALVDRPQTGEQFRSDESVPRYVAIISRTVDGRRSDRRHEFHNEEELCQFVRTIAAHVHSGFPGEVLDVDDALYRRLRAILSRAYMASRYGRTELLELPF